MRVLVVHDEFGVIHSVVQAELLPDDLGPGGPRYSLGDPAAGQVAVEIPAEGIAVELSPMELHENYRFDVRRGVLVPKE